MKGIPGRFAGDVTSSRAIYPSSKPSWFITLLIISKVCHCLGIFVAYDLLKTINVVPLLCLVKLIAGTVFIIIQKPFSSGKLVPEGQWFHVLQHSALKAAITLLWFFGLSLCGPFRTVLIFEHYDFLVITGIGALLSGLGGPAAFRGATLFSVAIVSLLLFDHDEGQLHPDSSHMFSNFLSWLGLADHKSGVLLLLVVLLAQVGANAFTRRLGGEFGGVKRLHAVSTLLEGIGLIPWSLLIYFRQDSEEFPLSSSILPLVTVALFVWVVDYYVDSVCLQRLEVSRAARIGSITMFLSALAIAIFRQNSSSATDIERAVGSAEREDHTLSGGGMFACLLLILSVLSLSSSGRTGTKGSFVGYSAGGLPLYNFTSSSLHQTSKSIFLLLCSILKKILEDHNSRRIFYFLCLNLSFTVVELLYGIWTNSLGLISDGFHMLFDCSALVMGLLASVMARWKPSKTFSYGYSRVEDLSGFVNGLFLLVISFFVFTEAISRLLDPPSINTQQLLTVSVAGLCVNLMGILAFRYTPQKTQGHQHHNHSHGGFLSHHGHSHFHNSNMEGVFLHIMADTLGSIGVITSSVLIEQFGWFVADPLCSIFIAVLIFISVIPLLKHSSLILLLRIPVKYEHKLSAVLEKVLDVKGVTGVRNLHFWQHSSDTCVGTIHVQVTAETSEQKIIQQLTTLFKEIGFSQITVQVEKREFFTNLSSLGAQSQVQGYGFGITNKDAMVMVKAV